MDDAAQAIAVHVCAWRGAISERPLDCEKIGAFKGVFIPAAISGLLENAMYIALDQAQSMAETDSNGLNLSELEAA
ncbi:hypothetical protein COO09_17280 [Rhizorhabdus dicambivorans]|uniref:Uncharacterized protein n=2 Tax=Rhizorhabdus dicambivorans TaxID=1850238 RepID=A0A2A4FTD3_9SPHN|nr:hypothetical protein CMV14_15370 [Rhizorhabdus dicambivorans]PCE40954.1 hypothetical protein COO09_17280 [Rhizorhabdus dicambivorans]